MRVLSVFVLRMAHLCCCCVSTPCVKKVLECVLEAVAKTYRVDFEGGLQPVEVGVHLSLVKLWTNLTWLDRSAAAAADAAAPIHRSKNTL